MGRAISLALLAAGHEVTIFNRTQAKADALKDKGARVAPTAAEAIDASDGTILVLLDADSTRSVLDMTALRAVLRGKAVINAAAMRSDQSIAIGASVTGAGGRYSDMGVLGYPHQVEQRRCEYVISCDARDRSVWKDLFGGIGSAVYDAGEIGNAQKVVHALALAYVHQTVAVGSVVAAFERQALPLDLARTILVESPALAVANADYLIRSMGSRCYGRSEWNVDHMTSICDDLIQFSKDLHIDASAVKAIRALYVRASTRGFGSDDVTALYEVINPRPAATFAD
jgi:3-hydroxyisobutyrate dehydrogenase-like beta-hydroxyacid dehydrogenase